MRKLLIITFLALGSTLFAQNTKNLTEDVVSSIRDNYKQKSEADKGIRNALSNNDIRSLAVNRDVVGKADHQFK
ncbi:MAG: aminopeptidase, partial [Bacteroidales bacterium]|nr:aminopeptidase [Bacteroidales bacterium]